MLELLNNAWGLFEAAELRDSDARDRFMDVYYALSSADDAHQPWIPAGLGSEEEVQATLRDFEEWARAIRDRDSADGGEDG